MGRTAGSKNKAKEADEEAGREFDEDGNVIGESVPVEDFKPIEAPPIAETVSAMVEESEEIKALRAQVAELEEVKKQLSKQMSKKSLDELLKDPNFGSTSYLIVVRETKLKDQKGNSIKVAYGLSAFPDVVDPLTKKNLAPDMNFDGPADELPYPGRKQADLLRESSEPCSFRGEMIPIKEAVHRLRLEYLAKREEADRKFLAEQKV